MQVIVNPNKTIPNISQLPTTEVVGMS